MMKKTLADFQDLTSEQRAVLSALAERSTFTEAFYFTGGTLLKALGIVPRQSDDLDFFTFAEVDGREYQRLLGMIHSLLKEMFGHAHVTSTERGFLIPKAKMRIECVYDEVPPIDAFVSFGTLRTAGLRDLAAGKTAALCARDEVKDMIDIAFLSKKQGWLLKDLADMAEEKFQLRTFNEEKLLTELLAKRDALPILPEIFLRDGEKSRKHVETQVTYLLDHTTL